MSVENVFLFGHFVKIPYLPHTI